MQVTVTIKNFNVVGTGNGSNTEQAVREAIVQYNTTAYAQTKRNLSLVRAIDLDELIDWAHANYAQVTVAYDFDA